MRASTPDEPWPGLFGEKEAQAVALQAVNSRRYTGDVPQLGFARSRSREGKRMNDILLRRNIQTQADCKINQKSLASALRSATTPTLMSTQENRMSAALSQNQF